ncbi:MAG TPA: response regulator [Burkholderiales bacterium]|nr:response regulator [Burkholderiales bacterium]
MSDILVADDDVLTRGLVSDWLVEAGYRVRQVEDGEAALAVLRAHSVRLLITDMQMPRLSGAETLVAVRRELPALPVIAMSAAFGSRQTPSIRTALALGACRVLAKPFACQELLTAVREVLQST